MKDDKSTQLTVMPTFYSLVSHMKNIITSSGQLNFIIFLYTIQTYLLLYIIFEVTTHFVDKIFRYLFIIYDL